MIAVAIHSILILAIAYLIRPKELQWAYWPGLILKLTMGVLLGVVYFDFVHGGDTVFFHKQASELYELSCHSFSDYLAQLFTREYHIYKGEARNELFIKITSIFYLISGGSYWVASLYFSFISFLASWYFVLGIHSSYPKLKLPAIVAFLFWPSVVFWSSGVLKDSIINASVFFISGISVRYLKKRSFHWLEVLLFAVACLLLFYLKHYLFAVTLVVLSMLIWFHQILPLLQSKLTKILTGFTLMIGVVLLASLVNPKLNLQELPQTVVANYQTMLERSETLTVLFPNLKPSWWSILSHMPKSLFTGLFRPLPWEGTVSLLPFGIESLLVLLLFLLNIRYARQIQSTLPGWLIMLFILALASFLPLVSPNFGSLVRYKVAYLPFLLLLLMITPFRAFVDKRRIV